MAGFSPVSTNLDPDPSNNAASYSTVVTGSYDPNDKPASTSTQASDELYFIDQDEWIDYTIRFQNTGTDTAFNVGDHGHAGFHIGSGKPAGGGHFASIPMGTGLRQRCGSTSMRSFCPTAM
ncbi:MAG: hypothetical protein R2818_03585 [Flavobacteriales bacterium]